jgi:hypothetical protein
MFPDFPLNRLYRRTMVSISAHSSHFKPPVSISYPSLLSAPSTLSHSIGKLASLNTPSVTHPTAQSRRSARIQTVWESSLSAIFLQRTHS